MKEAKKSPMSYEELEKHKKEESANGGFPGAVSVSAGNLGPPRQEAAHDKEYKKVLRRGERAGRPPDVGKRSDKEAQEGGERVTQELQGSVRPFVGGGLASRAGSTPEEEAPEEGEEEQVGQEKQT